MTLKASKISTQLFLYIAVNIEIDFFVLNVVLRLSTPAH
jgi:hypothetical protein